MSNRYEKTLLITVANTACNRPYIPRNRFLQGEAKRSAQTRGTWRRGAGHRLAGRSHRARKRFVTVKNTYRGLARHALRSRRRDDGWRRDALKVRIERAMTTCDVLCSNPARPNSGKKSLHHRRVFARIQERRCIGSRGKCPLQQAETVSRVRLTRRPPLMPTKAVRITCGHPRIFHPQ